MLPITLVLVVAACVKGEQMLPLKVTCEPIVEWKGGPYVYRITLRNVSKGSIVIRYPRAFGHTSIRYLGSPVPGIRNGVVVGNWSNDLDEERPILDERLAPGDSMMEIVRIPYHRAALLTFPAKLSAVWDANYSVDQPDKPKKWHRAEISCPFTANPVKPSAAEVDRFVTELHRRVPRSFDRTSQSDPSLSWIEYTDKLQFFPVILRHLDAGDKYMAIQALYLIVETAKASPDTVPKLLLEPTLRGTSFLFAIWQEKDPTWPRPSKEMIAELGRAPNEWVQLLAWATFPDQIRDAPAALKKVHALMNPQPTPAVLALVKQLDADSFKTREEASKKLLEINDVEPMLQQILAGPGTPEQHQRVKQVLESFPKGATVSAAHWVIQALPQIDTPRSEQLMELMAKGPPKLRATQDAKKFLADRIEMKRRDKEFEDLHKESEENKKDKPPEKE